MSKAQELSSCPFCGAGETVIHVNQGTWTGRGYGEPVSVEVRHWCAEEPGQPSRSIVRAGRDEPSAVAAWNRRAASSEQQAAPRVQWWLATIDRYGYPTLTDGAHGGRAGADQAAYLIDALGVGQGKKYAVARVELSEPRPNADGVNHEAVAQCNLAARASNGGKAND